MTRDWVAELRQARSAEPLDELPALPSWRDEVPAGWPAWLVVAGLAAFLLLAWAALIAFIWAIAPAKP